MVVVVVVTTAAVAMALMVAVVTCASRATPLALPRAPWRLLTAAPQPLEITSAERHTEEETKPTSNMVLLETAVAAAAAAAVRPWWVDLTWKL
jgi:hypothetical protein